LNWMGYALVVLVDIEIIHDLFYVVLLMST
jgi:hypothetical protein